MDLKSLGHVEVKNSDLGTVSARFAYFDQKDGHGDVTLKGAFPEGKQVKISAYNHASWEGSLPVGKGTIHTDDQGAVFHGQFFMNTTAGRDTFEVVKQLGELGEWSYGLEVKDSSHGDFKGDRVRFLKELDVFEVSPVLRGAGINTRTLSAKSDGATFSGEAEAVLTALKSLSDRAADVMAKRREEGKAIGANSAELLSQIVGQLEAFKSFVNDEDDDEDDEEEEKANQKPGEKPEGDEDAKPSDDDDEQDDEARKAYLRYFARKHSIDVQENEK